MDWSNASDHFHRRVKAVLAGALLVEREGGNGKTNTLFDATNLDVDCPGSPLVLHVLGHVRAALGEADAALDPLRRARDLAPGNLDIAFTLAKTYAAREQFDLAAEECERALSLGDADLVDPELHAVVDLRQLGPSKEARISIAKQQLGDLLACASSKNVVTMGSQKEPSNMHWDDASDRFRERVKAVTGALPAARMGGKVKASTLCHAADLAKEWQGSPLALHVSGHVHAALGEAAAALDPLRRARDLAPGNLDIAFTLAKTYAAREQFDLAAEECKRALSLGDADLVDPELHAVFESRHLEPSKEARISIAKQPLRELLADTSSKIVVLMARDCWNGMSEEVRRSFLTVSIEEMKAPYVGRDKLSEQCQMRALTVAVDFAKGTRKWICWLCPQCKKVFLSKESFLSHVDDEFFPELKESLLFVPERISDEQAELIKSWTVPADVSPTEQAEGEKIKSAFKHLMDQRALSVDLFNNLVKFTKFWTGETTDHPQNHSCITSLDPLGLQMLGTCLDLLIPGLRAGDAEQDSCGHSDTAVDQDASVLSIGIEENVFRITLGSSNQDALFSWLSRPLRQDPVTSWISMRQACLDKGTHVLKMLDGSAVALIEKVKPKCGSIETDKHENYFSTKVKADVEIMQLDAEVDKLKKKLVEVCTCDYREIILPAMKDYLWAKLCNDPPENVLRSKDDAEANTENRVSVQEDINASLNISTSGIVLQEDDEKGAKDNPKGGDSTVPHDNVVEELPGDNKVLQSGQKLELPPRANENTLGSSQNTPIEKENKTSSPSDYSGSIEEDANISSNGVTGTAYPNSENELKSLYATLLSLWHLRPFSDKYVKKAHLFPHFGVSGEDCMLCDLFHTFSAFSDKNDSRATYRLKCLRASLIKFFNGANASLKEETNLAVKFTEVIFNMVHTSETATRVSKNSEKILYKTTLFSICHDHGCLSHGLFGMHKNAREITYFLNLGASELQNIETKSFAGVIESVDKQFHCNTESNAHNDPPRFFTTAFSYPSENDSQLDVSGLLLSFAAPWDINPVYEGLHSECKYTMVSAVFRAEGQDICFARVEEKWLVYDKTLVAVKDFDSWEEVLGEYGRSSLYPQLIFFERIDTV